MPVITLTSEKGSFGLADMVSTIRWSGDYRQCARTLEYGMLASASDATIPVVECPPGSMVAMTEGGKTLFSGMVVSRTGSTASSTLNLICYDRGFYLNRNQTSLKVSGEAPETATATLCREFGIPVGSLAATGIAVRKKFVAKSLYEIIMSLYTEAAKQNGKVYYVAFEGDKLSVLEKGTAGELLLLTGGSNLMDATVTESIEQVVNKVAVYDEGDNLLYANDDADSAAKYGVLQSVIRQAAGEDASAQAKAALRGPEQKITVNNLGDVRCVAGGAVMVREPYTGLFGKFYIDSDNHQWSRGVYTNKLVLNLEAVMDEKEAGEALTEAAGASQATVATGGGEG